MTPWKIQRLDQHERLARSRRQTRRLMRTTAVVSLSFTLLIVVALLAFDLKQEPTWQAALAVLAIWVLGVSLGWTLKWSFDSWVESA